MRPNRFGDNGNVSLTDAVTDFIEDAGLRWSAQRQIRYVSAVGLRDARGLLADTYRQIRREFLLATPFLVQSAAPEILAGFWSAFRESLVAGPASRAQREAIAEAVARINQCPFCADAHSMMLDGALLLNTADVGASAANRDATRASAEWALATRTPGAAVLKCPPFPKSDAAQMIGTALVFHYLNRIVNVFIGDSPLPAPSKPLLRGIATSVLAKRIVNKKTEPGASLRLLPAVPIPVGLEWAQGNPFVADAFARFYVAVENAARAALPEEVRSLVELRLATWHGEDPGLGTTWLDDICNDICNDICKMEPKPRAAARLVLLTALASYRVDAQVVTEFREHYPTDADLIAAVAWGSCAAMRRTETWI